MTVLVGYAGRRGPALEIAECVAGRLEEGGFPVEVRPLGDAPDPGRYGAFVLGSDLRGGAWPPEAMEFVRRNAGTLAGRPLWLFGVGGPEAVDGRSGERVNDPLGAEALLERLRPRGFRRFAQDRERHRLPPVVRLVYALVRGRLEGLRDPAEIDAWADGIACDLAAATHGR